MVPTMNLDQHVEIDSPESLLARVSEKAELTVLGHDHPALSGQMPLGQAALSLRDCGLGLRVQTW
jgi:hypothetical protein